MYIEGIIGLAKAYKMFTNPMSVVETKLFSNIYECFCFALCYAIVGMKMFPCSLRLLSIEEQLSVKQIMYIYI